MEPDERRARARLRAQAKFDFYRHLAVYVVVNLLLVVINLVTSRGYFWAIWPLLGWGFGVAIHALWVFVFGGNNDIVERLTERELRRNQAGRE